VAGEVDFTGSRAETMLLRRVRSCSFSPWGPLSLGLEVGGVAIECRVMAMKGFRRVERRGLDLSISQCQERINETWRINETSMGVLTSLNTPLPPPRAVLDDSQAPFGRYACILGKTATRRVLS
jgi:hypothetical protein